MAINVHNPEAEKQTRTLQQVQGYPGLQNEPSLKVQGYPGLQNETQSQSKSLRCLRANTASEGWSCFLQDVSFLYLAKYTK